MGIQCGDWHVGPLEPGGRCGECNQLVTADDLERIRKMHLRYLEMLAGVEKMVHTWYVEKEAKALKQRQRRRGEDA